LRFPGGIINVPRPRKPQTHPVRLENARGASNSPGKARKCPGKPQILPGRPKIAPGSLKSTREGQKLPREA